MTPSEAVLDISHVDLVYRTGFWLKPTQVLFDVSLQVPRRSVFGFLGANGAGKTTLIQLIVGIRRPTRGAVRIEGMDASEPLARSRIGFLPERPYFHEHLTGEQLLHYFGALAGMTRQQVDQRIPAVLETVGMAHARQRELRKFSKGMLQRIGIAQAILHDPEFLILDEPMSGLDPQGRKEIRELIAQLAASGKTVFFSSHVIPDVEALCDRVAVIEKGRITQNGSIRDLLQSQVQGMELRLGSLPREQLPARPGLAVLRASDDELVCRLERAADLNALLSELISRGAVVHSIQPVRPSLEALFQ